MSKERDAQLGLDSSGDVVSGGIRKWIKGGFWRSRAHTAGE